MLKTFDQELLDQSIIACNRYGISKVQSAGEERSYARKLYRWYLWLFELNETQSAIVAPFKVVVFGSRETMDISISLLKFEMLPINITGNLLPNILI